MDGARRAERCDCWRAGVAEQMLSRARIPARYSRCDFSTFITYDNEKLQRAFRKAREFAAAFPVVDKGLLFIGPPGIGKTHVAVSVLREVVLKGMRGVYYDTRSLLSTIRSTYNPVTRASEAEVLDEVMQAELLVLDDLGAERLTDWVEETMHLIVKHPLQREASDGLHHELRGRWRRGPRLAVRARGLPSPFAAPRDVRFSRVRRAGLPRIRAPRRPRSSCSRSGRCGRVGPAGRPHGPDDCRNGTSGRARARLPEGQLDLGWAGGKAGT